MTLGAVIEALTAVGELQQLADGEVICRQGDDSDSAFVVTEGRLETLVAAGDDEVVVGTHGPGSLVGEVTALVGGQRTATLRAAGPTTVSAIPTEILREVFDRHPTEAALVTAAARDRTDRSRVATLLARELDTTDQAAIAAIATRVTWRNLGAGEVLFEAGDPADGAYIVLAGRLTVESPAGVTLAQVGRGAVVGEFGLLEGRARAATVRARRDSNLAMLSRDDFASMATRHAGLAMGLVRRIIERSGRETSPARRVGRSACVLATGALDGEAIAGAMVAAMRQLGPTAHLWPQRVDSMLGAAGASAIRPGEIGDVRLAELLHQVDADHQHVLLQADTGNARWTATALGRADQVVIVTSADPDERQEREIRNAMALVPDETPVWLALDHPPGTRWPEGTGAVAERFGVDEVHHVVASDPVDLARLGRLAVGRGRALVLSGGGARGFAHLGVMQALDELGIAVDRFAGTSMGAVIGAGLALGLDHEERLDVITRHFRNLLDYTIPVVSLIKGKRVTDSLRAYWGDHDIEDLWAPFSCVAANLTTSQVVPFRRGPIDLALRASTAIPGVLPPVPHGGELLVDGGVLDNLPVDLVADDPSVATIIAVDVAPPTGPRAHDDFGLSVSGWAALRARLGRGPSPYPGVVPVLMRTMLIGSARDRDRAVAGGAVDLHLALELRGVGLLDFESVPTVAAAGYEASIERIAAWWDDQPPSQLQQP